jgi:hypothetical protein
MGGLSAVAASVLRAPRPVSSRSLEVPSIVPTADGLVGFCTITAQRFADFLVLIERPDLLDDADLASFAGRTRRRTEFQEMVETWAATRTTAEIVDVAAAFRIPVAPIGTPTSVTEIDHFRERGVFVKNAAGQFQPRAPYRSDAFETVAPREPPKLGEPGVATWTAPPAETLSGESDADALPLAGLRVVDFTAFWAGPSATHTLAAPRGRRDQDRGIAAPGRDAVLRWAWSHLRSVVGVRAGVPREQQQFDMIYGRWQRRLDRGFRARGGRGPPGSRRGRPEAQIRAEDGQVRPAGLCPPSTPGARGDRDRPCGLFGWTPSRARPSARSVVP